LIASQGLIHKAWHQELEERIGLGFEANISVGRARLYSREAFFIDHNVERCCWANFGLNRIGRGDCVE